MAPPFATTSLREGLLGEHARIQQLLDAVIAASEDEDAAEVNHSWRIFALALRSQMAAEDAQLVSHLPQERSARILSQEHQYLRGQMNELERTLLQTGGLQPKALGLFRDILQAHARNDDRLLYGWAELDLDEHRRDVVLEALRLRLATNVR